MSLKELCDIEGERPTGGRLFHARGPATAKSLFIIGRDRSDLLPNMYYYYVAKYRDVTSIAVFYTLRISSTNNAWRDSPKQ